MDGEGQNADNIVNVEELSDNELINNVVPSIARRLESRKVKDASVTLTRKTINKKTIYGPPKAGSKVVPPSSKRKSRHVSSSDDDEDDIKRLNLSMMSSKMSRTSLLSKVCK